MSDKRLPTLNRVLIVGNLTKDPELRNTTNGTPVVNFRVAASRRFRDGLGNQKEEVCYVGVVAWQRLAEACFDYLRKGSAVFVEGELQSRNWETEDGAKRSMVEIHAHKIQFLDKRPSGSLERDEDEDYEGYSDEGSSEYSQDDQGLKGDHNA